MLLSFIFHKKEKSITYSGEENKGILLDLLYTKNILELPTVKNLYRLCIKYEIKNERDYNQFKVLNKRIPLKNNIYEYNGFKWKNVDVLMCSVNSNKAWSTFEFNEELNNHDTTELQSSLLLFYRRPRRQYCQGQC